MILRKMVGIGSFWRQLLLFILGVPGAGVDRQIAHLIRLSNCCLLKDDIKLGLKMYKA